jgi:hypothetical protein
LPKLKYPKKEFINLGSMKKFYEYYDFLQKINVSNNQYKKGHVYTENYKIYIATGNNSKVIKDSFKKR